MYVWAVCSGYRVINALRNIGNKKSVRMLIDQSSFDPTYMGKGFNTRSEKIPENQIFTLSLKSGKKPFMYVCLYV
jgi:hypothetical protein